MVITEPTLKKKIILIIFGFSLVFVCIEIFLRIIGAGYLFYRQGQNKSSIKSESDSYTILCLGDSFTFGIGAKKDHDYPRHLKNMLKKNKLDLEFKVINAGIGGQNSSEVLYSLDSNLKKYNPNLIVLLIGMNDGHNTHLQDWALNKKKWHTPVSSRIKNLRVFKLFKIAYLATKNHKNKNDSNDNDELETKDIFLQKLWS
ncbi:MAG: hypothetical protein KAJ14_08405, partial [Candidatus Omnitrophica bacterium]|nr:hypothetical protein [Candidatus Omnitrophota bacterium]MCK5493117.1 hypothetical protein [Candidatus Omnitrophota bacterium]